jgi:DNA adenine methylase
MSGAPPALPAPFPYFGGKRRVAPQVWLRLGDVPNYVEPFFGSGAVLLGRPTEPRIETVNDLDGFICNFWRATKAQPERVAEHASNPVNENDLHARHAWLVSQREELRSMLEGDPERFDAKIAGWWVWGLCCWIGSGWCSGKGPWSVTDGRLLLDGVMRKRPHLSDAGQGVNRQLPHLGNAGQGVNKPSELANWFQQLSVRLARVRVASGDWSRVVGPSVTHKLRLTGVFLDPPYADTADRSSELYRCDSEQVAHAVRDWAVANGDNKKLRIALCGYEGEHEMPKNWSVLEWSAGSGFGGQAAERTENGKRERIWFSPACLRVEGGMGAPILADSRSARLRNPPTNSSCR